MNAGIGNGCYVFVYHISNAPLELGIRFVFVSSGLSSHAGIFIFVLFLKLFKDGFSNLRTDSNKVFDKLRTSTKPGTSSSLGFDLLLVFSNKNSLSLQRKTWSFLGQEASRGSHGAAGSVAGSWTLWESAEPYTGSVTQVCCAVPFFTCSIKGKIETTSGYKDFSALSWEVCSSFFAEQ